MVTALLMVVTCLTLAGLLTMSVVALARRHYRQAVRRLIIALIVVAAYTAALIGFGLASRPVRLPYGQAKCFDEWCGTVLGVRPAGSPGSYSIQMQLSNKGRHVQRGSGPRLWFVTNAGRVPIAADPLHQAVSPAEPLKFSLTAMTPRDTAVNGILLTEGGFPSRLTIGDENSPFHAQSYWPVAPTP